MDLSAVPTSELLVALTPRFDHVVIVGVHTVLEDGVEAEAYEMSYKGTKTTAFGLLERAKISLTEEVYVDMYGPVEIELDEEEDGEEGQ